MRYLVLLGVLGATIAAYVAYWLFLSNEWRDGVAAWAAMREARGAEAAYADIEASGFPFRIVTTVAAPRLAFPDRLGSPSWAGERIAALTHPWTPTRVLVSVEGEQAISFDADGSRHHLIAIAERALASYRADSGGDPQRISVDLHGLTVTEPATGDRAEAARVQLHARPGQAPHDVLDLSITLETVDIHGFDSLLDSKPVTLASLQATVRGAAPDLDLPLSQALAAWSREGGALEITRLELVWGDVRVHASGTLALDEAMRPIGALTADIAGHDELLDAVVAAGRLSPDSARQARPLLDVLAAANGGTLSVPVRLQDGLLFLGPVAVAKLRPLVTADARSPAQASPVRRR